MECSSFVVKYMETLLRQLPIIPKIDIPDNIADKISDKITENLVMTDYNIIKLDSIPDVYIPQLQLRKKYIIHDIIIITCGWVFFKNAYWVIKKMANYSYNKLSNNFIKNHYKNKKLNVIKNEMSSKLKLDDNHDIINTIPVKGLTTSDILDLQNSYLKYRGSYENEDCHHIFLATNEYLDFIMTCYKKFIYTTSLHNKYPDVLIMENEIIRMVSSLLHGNSDTCGTVTSNNTESIFLACKTYKEQAKKMKNIIKPEIILATSANAAFYKAAKFLDIKLNIVACDNYSYTIGISDIKKHINKNTICIVGSAPTFSHGLMDNIFEISELGIANNIGVHVDCSNSGFLLPFITLNGAISDAYDFSLQGVTSISIDTYKYGCCLNGASLILYRNKTMHEYQYFTVENWQGGVLSETSFSKDKLGCIIATTWSSLLYHGINGYIEYTNKILKFKNKLVNDIRKMPDLQVIGNPVSSIIAITSRTINPYNIASEMSNKGWRLNILQNPKAFHIHITERYIDDDKKNLFIRDLNESIGTVKLLEDDSITETPIYNSNYKFNSNYNVILQDISEIYSGIMSDFGMSENDN
jgi:sphinganine-1-phosphate aldolase